MPKPPKNWRSTSGLGEKCCSPSMLLTATRCSLQRSLRKSPTDGAAKHSRNRMDIDQASGRHYGMFSGITLATQWDCSAMRTPDIRREPASGSTISRLPSSRHFAWTPAAEPVSELAVGSPSPLPWRRCRRRNSMAGIWFFGSRHYRLERRTARSRKKMLSEPQAHSDDGRPGRQGNRNLGRRQS